MLELKSIASGALLALPVVWSVGFSATAQAETTIYNGAICQPYWGSQAGDFVTRGNGFQNWSNANRSVTCPIDRQVPWYSGSSDTYITIYVYNAGGTIYCSGHARSRSTGNILDSEYRSVSSTGNRTMLFRVRGGGRMYNVGCTLTPNSYIRAFYVSEPE